MGDDDMIRRGDAVAACRYDDAHDCREAIRAIPAADVPEVGKMLAEQDHEYNRKTNDLIERHTKQTTALRAKNAKLAEVVRAMATFDGRQNNTHLKKMALDAIAEGAADEH